MNSSCATHPKASGTSTQVSFSDARLDDRLKESLGLSYDGVEEKLDGLLALTWSRSCVSSFSHFLRVQLGG